MTRDKISLCVLGLVCVLLVGILLCVFSTVGGEWVTVTVSIVGGGIVAWIASYAGAKAGGDAAKEAAIEGARKAAELIDICEKRKQQKKEEALLKRFSIEIMLIEPVLENMQTSLSHINTPDILPGSFQFNSRVKSYKEILDNIRNESLFIVNGSEIFEQLYIMIEVANSSYKKIFEYAKKYEEVSVMKISLTSEDGKEECINDALKRVANNYMCQISFTLKSIENLRKWIKENPIDKELFEYVLKEDCCDE